jgi:transposase, IS30 family
MSRREPLRFEEREIISRELSRNPGCSSRSLGKILDRHHSTIAREIDRNGGAQEYRAVDAQRRADENRPRPKSRKLETSQRLHDAVNDGLREKWSPKQISERLREDHPDDPEMHVSHETIYDCLYLQARGELRTQLTGKVLLRHGRNLRTADVFEGGAEESAPVLRRMSARARDQALLRWQAA